MTGSRRVGVLGGTFDPVHLGHLVVASEAADRLQLDEVLLVPAGRPWQKGPVSAAEHRVEMTRRAVAEWPDLAVSTVDVDRGGETYTVDTLTDLRGQLGDGVELVFVIGADALALLPTWHEAARVLELATVVGVTRPGHELLLDPELPSDRVQLLEVPAIDVSSTELRERVRTGRTTRFLLPRAVGDYIAEHGLYRDGVAA